MEVVFDKKAGDKLANILCEVDALIADGSIKIGVFGLSQDSADFINLFYKGLSGESKKKVTFTDRGLHLG